MKLACAFVTIAITCLAGTASCNRSNTANSTPMKSDAFEGPFLDQREREIFVLATCPPLGKTRINVGTTAIDVELDFSEPDTDGKSALTTHAELDPEIAHQSLSAMQPLWERWDALWPKIYDAMVAIRTDYGREEPMTASNAKITFSPPGDYIDYETENWSCAVEIEPWDGYYDVEFELDGTIVDSGATF